MSRRPKRKGSVKNRKQGDFVQWVKDMSNVLTDIENEAYNHALNKCGDEKRASYYGRMVAKEYKYDLVESR